MSSAIEFDDVRKTYGPHGRYRPAIDGVSFRVAPGEFVVLIGRSGAGKTTLLKLILAMEQPDRGTIRVAGRDVHRLTRASIPYLRRNLGVVFQDFRLLLEATALENVRLALQVLGMPPAEIRDRSRQALTQVGLDWALRKPVRSLSGGEQQRVALARALVSDAPIVLADEPTGNLDPELGREMIEQLDAARQRGTTIVLATHDPSIRSRVAGARVLQLDEGRLIEDSGVTAPGLGRGLVDAESDAEPVVGAVA